MANDNDNSIWRDLEIQPSVIAGLIRQFNRYAEADAHQVEHEILSFGDYVNQIIVRGMVAYEPTLAEIEELIEKAKA